ncbi:hypothetical protein DPMN_004618 [Dreissena polymorpha]|uniref:Uncharacterized protein n=1 Tax=Dreissena polymorpha TaxID=45954 RepID=A0A9D4RT54_DREPO|nr:hypothetical protein DPMN_004618 [Dreissena polymorpha]
MELSAEIHKQLPVYHTRAMRREFYSLFGQQMSDKAGFLREAYRRLTGDCSASVNYEQGEVDKKNTYILEMEDPDIIDYPRIDKLTAAILAVT